MNGMAPRALIAGPSRLCARRPLETQLLYIELFNESVDRAAPVIGSNKIVEDNRKQGSWLRPWLLI